MLLSKREVAAVTEMMPGIDCGEGDRLYAPPVATREQQDNVLRYLVAYRYRTNDRMDAFRMAMRLRRFMRTGDRFPQEGEAAR